MTEEEFKEFYNKHAPDSYDRFVYHLSEQIDPLNLTDKEILDVGCGKGFVSMWIALFRGARKVVALDQSEGAGSEKGVLAFLGKASKDFNMKNIEVVKSDIMKNRFPNGSFDAIISNNALHHVVHTGKHISNNPITRKEWIGLFCELKRLLRPNGVLIVGSFQEQVCGDTSN